MRISDGPHTNTRGIPIYCPYWGRGCQWSCDTVGQTGLKFLEQHLAGARARGCEVHLQPVKAAA